MKKIVLFLIVHIFCNSTIQSQNDITGIYVSKSGINFIIDKDSFKLIMPNAAQNGLFSEIMADGTIKQIDKSFIELNSVETPAINVAKSIKITQKSDQPSNDSIRIVFSIPYRKNMLKIIVYTNTSKSFEFSYSTNNTELAIPNNIKEFSLYIIPEYIRPHIAEGLSYGIIAFDSLEEYPIEKNVNRIDIEIPAIDDSFFEKYYVKGDYAKVSKRSIIWKGETFIKKR